MRICSWLTVIGLPDQLSRGEAPEYDSWLAHPAMNPAIATATAKAKAFMGCPLIERGNKLRAADDCPRAIATRCVDAHGQAIARGLALFAFANPSWVITL